MALPGWIRRRRTSHDLPDDTAALARQSRRTIPELMPDPPERKEPVVASCPAISNPDPLMGPRTRMPGRWRGLAPVSPDLPIVVMAGHADSQNMDGSGTPGYAVDVLKQRPMDGRMRDELYWNFKVQQQVVQLGRQRGLNISGYTPPSLTIRNHRDPSTNWA